MDRMTRAQIDSLLYEVRNFRDRGPWNVEVLARRYKLDPMMVRGLLETEGVIIEAAHDGTPDEIDPNQSTQVMSTADIFTTRS